MKPTMRNHVRRGSVEDLEHWISEAAQQINRNPVQLRITVGDQATLTRVIGVQVVNRRREAEKARVPVTVWVSPTETGNPSMTGIDTISVTKGYSMLTGNAGVYVVLPDLNGQVELTVTALAPGDWWFFATCGDEPAQSGLVEWA